LSEEEQEGSAAGWESLKVVFLRKDGDAGIRLSLGTDAKSEVDYLNYRLYGVHSVSTVGKLETSEDLFDTRHIELGMEIDGEIVHRPFTPVLSTTRMAMRYETDNIISPNVLIDLAIRVYDNGELTPKLAKLEAGQNVQVKAGELKPVRHLLKEKSIPPLETLDELYLFAGGSGITPLLQIVQNVLDRKNPQGKTLNVKLVYANKQHSRALCLDELDDLIEEAENSTVEFKLIHLLSAKSDKDSSLTYNARLEYDTRASDETFLNSIGLPTSKQAVYVTCGPAAFMSSLKDTLGGYPFNMNKENYIEFEG